MEYKVTITGPAKRDLNYVSEYISEELQNKAAAKSLILEARKAIRSLNHMPSRHALVNDEFLAGRGIRIFPVKNHIVFYVVREETKTVVIERFLYGKRDWATILKSDTFDYVEWQQKLWNDE